MTLRRILVVDDDEGLNTLIQRALQKAGFETKGALTGAEAIEIISADPGMVMLLDQQLPDMEGLQLIRSLADKGQKINFVAMTGFGNEKTAVEYMKLGARDYLVKNLELTDTLPQVFRRMFRELETETRLLKAEDALRKSEENYRQLVQNANSLIIRLDSAGRITFANDYAQEFFGDSQPEILELHLLEALIPATGSTGWGLGGYVKRLVQTPERFMTHENEYIRPSGDKVWMAWTNRPIVDDSGEYRGALCIGNDITRLKLAEEAIITNASNLNTIFNSTPNILILVDSNVKVERINQVGAKFAGNDSEYVIGRLAGEVLHCLNSYENQGCGLNPECSECPVRTKVDSTFETKQAYHEEEGRMSFVLNGHETEIDLLISTNLLKIGDAEKVLVSLTDITERKNLERSLHESQDRFRAVIEHINAAIFVIQDDRYVFANQAAARLIGVEPEDVLGKRVSDFIASDDLQRIRFRHKRRLSGEAVNDIIDHELVTVDGKAKWVQTTGALINWMGKPANLAFGIDITEQRNTEMEKRQLESKLWQAQRMESLGTLAGGIAHDFNNILTAIQGYSELVLQDAGAGTVNDDDIKEILKACDRAKDLITQILTFSRKIEPKFKPVDLNRVVEQTEKMLERMIPKMIKIEHELSPGLWRSMADLSQLTQVIMNLGTNAKDAMPDGGTLRITTRNVVLDDEFCRKNAGSRPGEYVLLAVRDTGHGMDSQTMEHIFDPFYTQKEVGKGTGLGLATVFGIIKKHNGYITCHSQPGQGATFRIYLPAKTVADAAGGRAKAAVPELRGGNETILLVDDEQPIRELGRITLGRMGYKVLPASSGEKALEVYQDNRRDIALVILDINMPGMGGYKCLQKLREIDPEVKVVIASGYSQRLQSEEERMQDTDGFVAKPFAMSELLAVIREVLGE
jgi:PAS domain S-box-containing protein